MKTLKPRMDDSDNPLVSMLVTNYNYGRYLRECLDSIINQEYDNIEIVFSDNSSTDDSWGIVNEYVAQHPDAFFVARKRMNFGPVANFDTCLRNASGKYIVNMCSDDVLHPEYVKKCVETFKRHPEVGFVMVHRSIIDDNGNMQSELPFYNVDCKIPGEMQAAVYMMASVNPAVSQIMYRSQIYKETLPETCTRLNHFGARAMDFGITCRYPIAYLKQPLLLHRVHGESDSFAQELNLSQIMGQYNLLLEFLDAAKDYGLAKVIDRFPAAVNKLSHLSLRFALRAITRNDNALAEKYLHLALALNPDSSHSDEFKLLREYLDADTPHSRKSEIFGDLLASENFLQRNISYDPPEGSLCFDS